MKNKASVILACLAMFVGSIFYMPASAQLRARTPSKKPLTCKVSKDKAEFYVTATDKNIFLKKGTLLRWKTFDMHQGLIAVEAKLGKRWSKGEILLDDTSCK